MDVVQKLQKKIAAKETLVGVIGMGYVGKSLAELVHQKNFPVIGFVREKKATNSIYTTTDASLLKTCDILLVCVQTPIDETKKPDLRYLQKSIGQISQCLRKGQLIIIESSISVGTTRNVVLPLLQQSGLTEGEDYFIAFSPERMDPGNKEYTLDQIPKVVGGLSRQSHILAVAFYEQIINKVVPVSSPETAELVKLFENTFRFINISLVNEINSYAKTHGINMWEVIDAAATKPFGFLAHYPSPGVGGHCIPVDPFYLLDDADKHGIQLRLIQESEAINDSQPRKVAQRALEILHSTYPKLQTAHVPKQASWTAPALQTEQAYAYQYAGMKGGQSSIENELVSNYRILLIGLAYKPDIDDMRESASLKIWKQLEEAGCTVSYHDPYIPVYKNMRSKDLSASVVKKQDMIIIVTKHSNIEYAKLASHGVPILDTRNIYTNGRKFSHIFNL